MFNKADRLAQDRSSWRFAIQKQGTWNFFTAKAQVVSKSKQNNVHT